jgi:hypothetical protein
MLIYWEVTVFISIALSSGPDLQLWGPGAIKMWRPLSVATNLGYIVITYT